MTATKQGGAGGPAPHLGGTGLRDAPGPGVHALPGTFRDIWRDRLGLMTRVTADDGDAVRFQMGPKTLYFFNNPDYAKHVLSDNAGNYRKGIGLIQAKRVLGEGLLTSEGEMWRQQRRTIAPTFRRDRIAGYAGVIVDAANALLARLRAQADRGPVNVTNEMTRLTLGVLGQTLLDTDLSPFHMLGPAFEVAQDQAMFEMTTLGMVPHWLPLPRNHRFRHARRQLEEVVSSLVAAHGADGRAGGDDMISRLLEAHSGATGSTQGRRQLRDELVTILLAGHETTASTLSWTWYLVGGSSEVAGRLHAEAVEVLGDRAPTYDDLPSLRYTTMVIQEAMRLYPPVWILPRRAVAADEIDGYRVPPGADVMICPYTLHRHPTFWPEPDHFDPGRFSPDRSDQRHRYAYIPFGAGPRVCVGSNLGMLEATLVVAMVAREFRLGLVPGQVAVADPMLSLRVRGGLQMIVNHA
jgi:enediyne biosynthesis protein E7